MFGDPFDGQTVGVIPASKIVTYCHDGDNICDGGILVLAPHHTVGGHTPSGYSSSPVPRERLTAGSMLWMLLQQRHSLSSSQGSLFSLDGRSISVKESSQRV